MFFTSYTKQLQHNAVCLLLTLLLLPFLFSLFFHFRGSFSLYLYPLVTIKDIFAAVLFLSESSNYIGACRPTLCRDLKPLQVWFIPIVVLVSYSIVSLFYFFSVPPSPPSSLPSFKPILRILRYDSLAGVCLSPLSPPSVAKPVPTTATQYESPLPASALRGTGGARV